MREALNSLSLYRKNIDLYTDFFIKYPLIISSPGGFILSGAHTHFLGGMALHQRIPLRNYLGVDFIPEQKVICQQCTNYDIYEARFIDIEINQTFKNLADYCLKKLVNHGFKGGLNIGQLNEIPRRHGLNNPGAHSANLSALFLFLSGIITPINTGLLQGQSKTQTRKIFKIGAEFHSQWNTVNSSGFGCLASFSDSRTPIVYQDKYAFPLYKAFNFNDNTVYPIDLIVIGTGDRGNIDFPLSDYKIKIEKTLELEGIDKLNKCGFNIKQPTLNKTTKHFLESYLQTNNASTLFSILTAGEAFSQQTSDSIGNFLFALDNSYQSLKLLGNLFSRKNLATNTLIYYLNTHYGDSPFAITTSIANHIVLITINDAIREGINNLAKFLKKSLNFKISFPYISWIDGFERNGSKIEQWMEKNIRSPLFPKGSPYILYFNPKTNEICRERVNVKNKSLDQTELFINTDENKIYIKGEKIDSSELPSSVATIILLTKIFKTGQYTIPNDKLPDLSYFRERNELQSKIITPLKKVFKQKTGKDFCLKIKGALYNFRVEYYPSNLSIRILLR